MELDRRTYEDFSRLSVIKYRIFERAFIVRILAIWNALNKAGYLLD